MARSLQESYADASGTCGLVAGRIGMTAKGRLGDGTRLDNIKRLPTGAVTGSIQRIYGRQTGAPAAAR